MVLPLHNEKHEFFCFRFPFVDKEDQVKAPDIKRSSGGSAPQTPGADIDSLSLADSPFTERRNVGSDDLYTTSRSSRVGRHERRNPDGGSSPRDTRSRQHQRVPESEFMNDAPDSPFTERRDVDRFLGDGAGSGDGDGGRARSGDGDGDGRPEGDNDADADGCDALDALIAEFTENPSFHSMAPDNFGEVRGRGV